MATLLFVGDIHLGRRPVRLPAALTGRAAELGPAEAWRRTVELALREGVDAMVLAGDVVESVQDRFEAVAPLERGFRKLAAAGIPVHAVAGNHDVQALPRLAGLVEGFHLLGADGRWEAVRLDGSGGPVWLLGRSFRQQVEREDPLQRLAADDLPDDGAPVLGVLHCDLGASGSRYAPVPAGAFQRGTAARTDGWLLGHVHKPDALTGNRPVGYLGSLAGLDPGEPGAHGPWLVTVTGRGAVHATQNPLAPLRWEGVEASLDGLAAGDTGDVEDAVFGAVQQALVALHERLSGSPGDPRVIGARVRLVGRVASVDAVQRAVERLRETVAESSLIVRDGLTLFAETVQPDVAPALDLEALARGSDPVGLLAADLLALEREQPRSAELVAAAEARFAARLEARPWNTAGGDAQPAVGARALLLRAGRATLERLLAQRGAAGPGGAA